MNAVLSTFYSLMNWEMKTFPLFDELMPHSHCFLWRGDLVPWYLGFNGAIFTSYMLIGGSLLYIYRKRKETKYPLALVMYGAFILLCGVGHLIMSVNMFKGYYVLETVWHGLTAVVSLVSAFFTMKLIRPAVQLPPTDHLEAFMKEAGEAYQWGENLKAILDMSTDGWWVWNVETGHDYLSIPWCNLLGYRQDDMDHHVDTWKNLLHPDDLPKALKAVQEHFDSKGEVPFKITARHKHKDGHWIELMDTGRVVKWSDTGSPLVMVGFERKVL